jgi:hypothetical protein
MLKIRNLKRLVICDENDKADKFNFHSSTRIGESSEKELIWMRIYKLP